MARYNQAWAAANADHKRDLRRKHYLNNREKELRTALGWNARNKEKVAASNAGWRRKNRSVVRIYQKSYRFRVRTAAGKHTTSDILRIYQDQDGKCYYCRTNLPDNYHVDHKIPVARGGGNSPDNLCCACPSCNKRKQSRTDQEFLARVAVA